MANVKAGFYKQPQHVIDKLTQMKVHYKGVWAEMERKLGLAKGRLSMIIAGRAPVTQEFLDQVKAKSGVVIPMESPIVTQGIKAVDTFVATKLPGGGQAMKVPPGVTAASLGAMKLPEKYADPTAEVVAIGVAMHALSPDAEQLLIKLLKFHLGEDAYSPMVVVGAIQDIAILQGVRFT